MVVYEDFEVAIRIGNSNLVEYSADDEEIEDGDNEHGEHSPVVNRYVEVSSAQEFKVKIKINRKYSFPEGANAISFRISLDGQHTTNSLCTSRKYRSRYGWVEYLSGRCSGVGDSTVVQKFMFGELEITQDSSTDNSQKLKKEFGMKGTIKVEVWPYKGEVAPDQTRNSHLLGEQTTKAVPEKALKGRAVTMAASVGDPEPTGPSTIWDGDVIGVDPLVTFVFEYRDTKSLKDLGIFARTPEPASSEDRDLDEMTPDELRELVRRQRALIDTREDLVKKEETSRDKRRRPSIDNDDEEIQELRTVKVAKVAPQVIEIDSD